MSGQLTETLLDIKTEEKRSEEKSPVRTMSFFPAEKEIKKFLTEIAKFPSDTTTLTCEYIFDIEEIWVNLKENLRKWGFDVPLDRAPSRKELEVIENYVQTRLSDLTKKERKNVTLWVFLLLATVLLGVGANQTGSDVAAGILGSGCGISLTAMCYHCCRCCCCCANEDDIDSNHVRINNLSSLMEEMEQYRSYLPRTIHVTLPNIEVQIIEDVISREAREKSESRQTEKRDPDYYIYRMH